MVGLLFLWHHHQPCYGDPATGTSALPWVRLHATKDYFGMARLLQEFPGIRATFNLVPSLVDQWQRYATGEASDNWLDLMKAPAATLSEAERARVISLGFHAHPRTMIARMPRYDALYRKKLVGARFNVQEICDLQVLSSLAWMHATLQEEDPVIVALCKKRKDFDEQDKELLFSRSREIARRSLDLYRDLASSGQIELTTSPYYHPILPLLCDFRSAFEALPRLERELPFEPISLREDARRQVQMAVEFHRRQFGMAPRGMWPSEGSVSEDIIPLLVESGIEQIATDEEILAASLGRPLRRDARGNLLDGALLYRPWRVRSGDAELSIVFRDHRLSDLIGFEYNRDPIAGVRDFLSRLEWIRDNSGLADPLVSVILDGENAWEHYPGGGVEFFRELYGRIGRAPWLRTVKLSEAIDARPPGERLPRLFPGSWINHDFYIWIGHGEDQEAWRLLLEARAALVEAETGGSLSAAARDAAWQFIYIAEGSDWFWWYGDDRTSGMDDVFDSIFRDRLRSVYRTIGRPAPSALDRPICSGKSAPMTRPSALLDVRIDGKRTSFFEWYAAGRFRARDEASSMSRAHAGAIETIEFGFNLENLFLAIDFGEARGTIFRGDGSVVLKMTRPRDREIEIRAVGRPKLDGGEIGSSAFDEILEIALPL